MIFTSPIRPAFAALGLLTVYCLCAAAPQTIKVKCLKLDGGTLCYPAAWARAGIPNQNLQKKLKDERFFFRGQPDYNETTRRWAAPKSGWAAAWFDILVALPNTGDPCDYIRYDASGCDAPDPNMPTCAVPAGKRSTKQYKACYYEIKNRDIPWVKSIVMYVINGGRSYRFTFSSPGKEYKNHQAEFNAVVNEFSPDPL